MDAISFSCQGESHIVSGKVCQDYSLSEISEDGFAMAIVCDGHGGKRYFRSDIGARIAAEVAKRNVATFIREGGKELLSGLPFSRHTSISTQIGNQDFGKQTAPEKAFRQLFGSIIYEWNQEVFAHAQSKPITEEEKAGLEARWIDEFNNGQSLEKVYGCTLILYVQTPEIWFAFQIGDGKCFSFDSDGQWSEPIPWDERCFLNKTTSICDSSAIDEFRYCFEGDGKFPIAVILGSDGIDDSFGAEENQANFYIQILKFLAKSGIEATENEIKTTLPQLSKIGSQDDMSIAMAFNLEDVQSAYEKLVGWQIANVKRLIADEESKIQKANRMQENLGNIANPTRQNMIDLQYANADEKRALETKEKLEGRLNSLKQELTPGEDSKAKVTQPREDNHVENSDAHQDSETIETTQNDTD